MRKTKILGKSPAQAKRLAAQQGDTIENWKKYYDWGDSKEEFFGEIRLPKSFYRGIKEEEK